MIHFLTAVAGKAGAGWLQSIDVLDNIYVCSCHKFTCSGQLIECVGQEGSEEKDGSSTSMMLKGPDCSCVICYCTSSSRFLHVSGLPSPSGACRPACHVYTLGVSEPQLPHEGCKAGHPSYNFGNLSLFLV